jgi:hypothetical protein
MCLQTSAILPWHDWNWSGDEIVYEPIIPASRTIPGTRRRYPIDIREFLTTTNNAVVHQKLGLLIDRLPPSARGSFRSHARGSFDFRVDSVLDYVATLRYLRAANKTGKCPDAWLYPDETLAQGGGDCEDLAFLLAALLLAAGVSGYCLRVALGRLHIVLPDGERQKHDHCWVMYQNESGVWEILEPLCVVGPQPARDSARLAKGLRPAKGARPARRVAQSVEYVPHYVFNADHLWLIQSRELSRRKSFQRYCQDRSFWSRFDPSFAAGVHNTIFDQALGGLVPAAALSTIKRKSLWLDANILTYDPRDHFDNGYIDESWAVANSRLAQFRQDNTDWDSFGAATHAIGDFYAHSSYLHFAALQNPGAAQGQAAIYSPGTGLVAAPDYTAAGAAPALPPFDLTSDTFSLNPNLWTGTKAQAAQQWAGQLLSGRYAQKYDPMATLWEGFTSIPTALAQAPGFSVRGSLPHHDEIAVDDQTMGKRHKLYLATTAGPTDRQAYANQFRWRFNTAVQHVRQALVDNYRP